MDLRYERLAGKNVPQLDAEIERWLDETDVGTIEAMQFTRTETNKPAFSVFYREAE